MSLDRSSLARYQDVIALLMLRAMRLPRERANNDNRPLRLAARNKQKRATQPMPVMAALNLLTVDCRLSSSSSSFRYLIALTVQGSVLLYHLWLGDVRSVFFVSGIGPPANLRATESTVARAASESGPAMPAMPSAPRVRGMLQSGVLAVDPTGLYVALSVSLSVHAPESDRGSAFSSLLPEAEKRSRHSRHPNSSRVLVFQLLTGESPPSLAPQCRTPVPQ